MNRRTLARWTCFVAALVWVGVARGQSVSITDDSARAVELAAPARRIVSLSPHLTEQLFAIGAGDRVVATTEHADYPAAARQLPRVGRAHAVDLEAVAAMRPDLIAVWGSGFPAALVAALKRLGVPVYVDAPTSLDGIAVGLERLGVLAGRRDAGAAAARSVRERLATLRAAYAGRRPVTVFYQVWYQPLMTLGGPHPVSEALAVCGGRNVFRSLPELAPQVSTEAVLAADPEVLVTAEAGGADRGALDGWRRFAGLQAVRHGRFVTLDADRINRHTPRMVEEIAVLCDRLAQARGDRR